MRRPLLVLLGLLAPVTSWGAFCALDVTPAATLLVPYVAVGMDGNVPRAGGMTTILRVSNVSSEAALIQLTVWSADGQAVIGLTQALSGFDMWTINFRDLLSGNWSAFDTSRAAQAPPNVEGFPFWRTPFEWGPDGRSWSSVQEGPWGWFPYPTGLPLPQKTSVVPGTGCSMPYGNTTGAQHAPLIVAALQAPLRARSHAGCGVNPVLRHLDSWLASVTADPLVFYATVDVVSACSALGGADPAYVGGILADRNVLVGDVLHLDGPRGTFGTTPAVAIEAGAPGAAGVPGLYQVASGVEDRREALPTAFAVRYERPSGEGEGGYPRSSSLMLWKTSSELSGLNKVEDCGSYMYYAWDDDEHVVGASISCPISPCGFEEIDPNLLPYHTQLVPLDVANFDLPGPSGWMLLLLPPSYAGFSEDQTPGAPPAGIQGVAAVRHEVTLPGGLGSAWEPAAVMGSAYCGGGPRNPVVPRRRLTGR